jgi:hypothetical protein
MKLPIELEAAPYALQVRNVKKLPELVKKMEIR